MHVEEEIDQAQDLDFSLWKKLLRYAMVYRRDVAWMCTAGIATALADLGFPLVTKGVIDGVIVPDRPASALWPYAIAYLGLTLLLAVSVWTFIARAGRIRTHVSHDIRRDGFAKLQQLSFSYYDRRPVGWLVARMTSDCERLSNILAWGILDVAWGITVMLGIAIVLVTLSWKLGLIVLTIVPVLAITSLYFRRRILDSARHVRRTNSRITAAYNESIMGVRTTKVFGRAEDNLAEFRGLTDEMELHSVRNQLLSAVYLPLILALSSVAMALAVRAGAPQALDHGLPLGTLVTFLMYTRFFFEPVQQLAHWLAEMQMAQASAERVVGLIETVPEIRDSDEVRARLAEASAQQSTEDQKEEEQEAAATTEATTATGAAPAALQTIEFDTVGFEYKSGETILKDLSLTVRAGETIALVGSTGGGKTTIVSLLCRFYEPTAGRVLFDGIDYRDRSLAWLRSQLGVVLQTPHVFSGTIGDNIRYGRLDATDEEVEQAAHVAGAHDFIARTDKGYASAVGEGGVRLSTGEKQLLSLARAMLARPRLLILDEATSSVDTATERRIQAGVERVLKGRTSFVIAHRLSTVRRADRILVIDKGHIVEQGTHEELLRQRGRYFDLYTQQDLRESTRREWKPAE